MTYTPHEARVGGFIENDGTIDFYLRIGSIANPDGAYLDLGAGRGAWFEDDECGVRRAIRDMRTRFKRVDGADVDPAIKQNRSIDTASLIVDGICSIPDDHIDPRRSAFFMARSVLRDIRSGVRAC